jgi:hypothetical protein
VELYNQRRTVLPLFIGGWVLIMLIYLVTACHGIITDISIMIHGQLDGVMTDQMEIKFN